MTRRLKAFATNFGTYEFPDAQLSFSTNFKNLVPSTKRLPGVDGGFDFYGDRKAPQEIGNVTGSLLVEANDEVTVQQLQDDLNRIAGWGKGYLYIVPQTDVETEKNYRFVRARINNISDPESSEDCPENYLRIQINFQVNMPFWQGLTPSPIEPAYNLDGLRFYDHGHIYGESGLVYTGPRFTSTTISVGDSITLYNMGSRPVRPLFRIKTASAGGWVVGNDAIINDTPPLLWGTSIEALAGFGIRQKVGGILTNEALWAHSLDQLQQLVIDCEKMSVIYTSLSGDHNGFPWYLVGAGFGFIELWPGTNTIEFFGTFTTDVTLDVEYFDSWY